MPMYEKLFWLILVVNFIGVCLTLGALWVYSRSMELTAQAIMKLYGKTKRIRQYIERNSDRQYPRQ